MTDHPNVGHVQEYLVAWAEPEADALLALCSEDAVMHIGGQHRVSGTYRGHAAWRDMYREFHDMFDSVETELEEVLADDGHAVVIFRSHVRRGDTAFDALNNRHRDQDERRWQGQRSLVPQRRPNQ